jgi:hypothetical protein
MENELKEQICFWCGGVGYIFETINDEIIIYVCHYCCGKGKMRIRPCEHIEIKIDSWQEIINKFKKQGIHKQGIVTELINEPKLCPRCNNEIPVINKYPGDRIECGLCFSISMVY